MSDLFTYIYEIAQSVLNTKCTSNERRFLLRRKHFTRLVRMYRRIVKRNEKFMQKIRNRPMFTGMHYLNNSHTLSHEEEDPTSVDNVNTQETTYPALTA